MNQSRVLTYPELYARWREVWLEYQAADALITAPDRRDPDLLAKLDVVAGRVLAA